MLGLGAVITSLAGNILIANCITQQRYGADKQRYVSYPAVYAALSAVAELSAFAKNPVHLPLIGGGLGGGDKEVLIEIFDKVFNSIEAHLWEL